MGKGGNLSSLPFLHLIGMFDYEREIKGNTS